MDSRKYFKGLVAFGCFSMISGTSAAADTLYVCAEAQLGCDFVGPTGLQDAVDVAEDGAKIIVRSGRYIPQAHRDIPFSDEGESLQVRGFVTIDGKDISITGEPGAVLDGRSGKHASAIVVRSSRLSIEGIEVNGFRAAEKEDNIYDGHGIFMIDSEATLQNVTIKNVQKMALTGRGNSNLTVKSLKILDSHLGIWLEEDARLHLENAHIEKSESAGIAAYDRTITVVSNSSFVGNEDDGVYATGAARICVNGSTITGNKPYGVRAVEDGRVHVGNSVLEGNEAAQLGARISKGEMDADGANLCLMRGAGD